MNKFLRKHNKRLLAIFTAFLMIVFILPSYNRMSQDRNYLIGHIGDEKIFADKIRQGQMEWDALKRVAIPGGRNDQQRWVPLLQQMFPGPAMEQIDSHQSMFYLLSREARKLGAQPNEQTLQQLMQLAAVQTADGRLVPIDQADTDRADVVRAAIVNLLLIQNAFDHQLDAIKLSEPIKHYELATQAQQISTDLVEFNAKDVAAHVTAPTTQQLQEQFGKYADVSAGSTSTTNPSGSGYRYSNRVKLQYLGVPREEVQKVVKAQKEDYLWEVDAQRYYQQNLSQFKSAPVTQPATTNASTQAATAPATRAVASTAPTTRPFAEVREEAIKAVVDPKVEELQRDIVSKIKSRLAADWATYRNATNPAASPTTATTTTASAATKPAPMTSYGVAFDSYEYIQKLAADIQKQTGVLPTVASIADTFKSQTELDALPGIGHASQEYLAFGMYATLLAQPFMPEAQRGESRSIALWQPSPVLTDERNNSYIFRLTAAEPAHKPTSMSEVAAAVESDWRKQAAYDLAKAKATQVKESAAKSSLSSAATGAGKTVTTTGLFENDPNSTVPNLQIDPAAKAAFLEQAFKLLEAAAKEKSPHPLSLIELPGSGLVMVAQLQDVKPAWRNDESKAVVAEMVTRRIMGSMVQSLYQHWFNYDDLTARLNYRDENPKKSSSEAPKTAAVQ